jgi:hypothetical protein
VNIYTANEQLVNGSETQLFIGVDTDSEDGERSCKAPRNVSHF